LLIAVAARSVDITHYLDGDELFSIKLASAPFGDMVNRSLADRPHPPLHYFLLYLLFHAFSPDLMLARSLSVLASSLGVIAGWLALRPSLRNGLSSAGLAATLAIGSYFVYFGQQARPYALIFLAATINLWAFLRLITLERPAPPGGRKHLLTREGVGWVLSYLMLAYAQYFSAVFLALEAGILFFYLRRHAWPLVIAGGAAGASILPWMAVAFSSTLALQQLTWIGPPSFADVGWYLIAIIGFPPAIPGKILIIGLGASFLPAILYVAKQGIRRARIEFALLLLAAVPPAIAFGTSHVAAVSIWANRQLMLSVIATVMALFLSLDRLPPGVRRVASVLVLAWVVSGAPDAWPRYSKPPFEQIAETLVAADAKVVVGEDEWIVDPLRYYGEALPFAVVTAGDRNGDGEDAWVCRVERCSRFDAKWSKACSANAFQEFPWDRVGGVPRHFIRVYWLRRCG
jgi:uncharacterized membrane protein